jgi:predicted enzyme related to lactoylglutathione lyase
MEAKIKFVHTNIIAEDWEKLAQFYIKVFNCDPVLPERDLRGEWADKLTTIPNVRIRGIHLSLPGYKNGPTLEIFEYSPSLSYKGHPLINRHGFSHIAFHVENVETTLKRIVKNGCSRYGELITTEIPGAGILTVVYTKDPEGNIVEVQNWKGK